MQSDKHGPIEHSTRRARILSRLHERLPVTIIVGEHTACMGRHSAGKQAGHGPNRAQAQAQHMHRHSTTHAQHRYGTGTVQTDAEVAVFFWGVFWGRSVPPPTTRRRSSEDANEALPSDCQYQSACGKFSKDRPWEEHGAAWDKWSKSSPSQEYNQAQVKNTIKPKSRIQSSWPGSTARRPEEVDRAQHRIASTNQYMSTLK